MATTTKNLNLVLPDYADRADVNVLNENFEKIDEFSGGGKVDEWIESINESAESAIVLISEKGNEVLESIPDDVDQIISDVAAMKDDIKLKADAIIDESAQANSHTLYAQSDYPIEVTVYGTADGICDVNHAVDIDGSMAISGRVVKENGVFFRILSIGAEDNSIAMTAGRFSRNGFDDNTGNTQIGTSREPYQYGVVAGGLVFMIKHTTIGTTSESSKTEAEAAILSYFAANPTKAWCKTADGTLCGAVVAVEAMNEVPYTERYRIPIALDAPLAEGETATAQIPCPKTITGAVTVSATGETSVTYAHDTKHYVDEQHDSLAGVVEDLSERVDNLPGGGTVEVDATLTVSGMAADAKATGDAISSLSEENAKIIGAFPSGSAAGKGEYPIEWTAGTINEGKESPANSYLRIRSSNIEVGKGVFVEITDPATYSMAKNVYTSDGTWLGQVMQNQAGTVTGQSSGFGVEPLDVDTVLTVFPNAAYFRLVLRKSDNTELLPEDGFNVKATGEVVNTGDWDGGHLDNYYVRKDKAVYSADEIVFTYDVDETVQTKGFLKLPPNYEPIGDPVPLIVFVHGSGDLNGITATSMTNTYEQYYNFLRDSGYAVFDCYSYGNKYSGGEDTWGLPINRKCYMAGVRYVCKTYNVDIDNVFVSCKSLGGIQALSMFYDETMPIKAVGMLAPELDPFNVYMGYAEIDKRNIAAELGFSEDAGNVLAFNQGDSVPEGFWDYITANMDKWSGHFAFFCGLPIKTSEKATYYRKGHTTSDMCRTSLNRPVKIWIAEDDNAVSYAVSSAFIQSLNNGGYKGELRTMPSGTGKHHAVDNDPSALQTTNVTTKCGVTYETVPTAYYELVQFFDKYCAN